MAEDDVQSGHSGVAQVQEFGWNWKEAKPVSATKIPGI